MILLRFFHPGRCRPRARVKDTTQPAVSACLRLWIESHGHSGRIAEARVMEVAKEITAATGFPLPILGKQTLRDGKSGIPYDQPVTVGRDDNIEVASPGGR